MAHDPSYLSKTPDADGLYDYSAEEHAVWGELYARQIKSLRDHACRAYLGGLDALDLGPDAVPQVRDIDAGLRRLSGAGVKGVAALIPQQEFSTLLSERKFPVATFLRRREDMDYLKEPDIFHEVFGHCPMMTNEAFCQFVERFGALALSLPKSSLGRLYRLFWFSVEFGLIRENGKLKAFGAGIMSSPSELAHATSGKADCLPFDVETVLRTPYRIDIVQPVYFVIDSFEQLAACLDTDIGACIETAKLRGDLPPRFEVAA